MIPLSPRRALLAGCLSLVCASASAAPLSYTTAPITIAGATYIYPTAINDAGTAVGYYGTSSGNPLGFTYAHGTITTISYPKSLETYVTGINTAGTLVGTYRDANGFFHGFTYSGSTFTSVSMPNATTTSLNAINDKGVALGSVTNPSGVTSIVTYAKGIFTSYTTASGVVPIAVAINNSGTFTGWYTDATGRGETSFINIKGITTTLTNRGKIFYQQAFGMNKNGVVVGQAASETGHQFGFRYHHGHESKMACPGSTECFFQGINDKGYIVGANFTAPDVSTGFVMDGKGTYTTLPAPNGNDTNYSATAVNNAGVIVGESSSAAFISTPTP